MAPAWRQLRGASTPLANVTGAWRSPTTRRLCLPAMLKFVAGKRASRRTRHGVYYRRTGAGTLTREHTHLVGRLRSSTFSHIALPAFNATNAFVPRCRACGAISIAWLFVVNPKISLAVVLELLWRSAYGDDLNKRDARGRGMTTAKALLAPRLSPSAGRVATVSHSQLSCIFSPPQ